MGEEIEANYLNAVAWSFIVLCPIIVILRFAARRFSSSYLGVDDWLMLPALAGVIGCGVVLIIGDRMQLLGYSNSNSLDTDGPQNASYGTMLEKLEWTFWLLQGVSLGSIKISFILLFRRVFVLHKYSIWGHISLGLLIVVVLWTLAFILVTVAMCHPGDNYQKKCWAEISVDLAYITSDFITDALVLLLPVIPVIQLQLRIGRKLLILGTFALGLVSVVASITRFVETIGPLQKLSTGATDSPKETRILTTKSLYWSMIESGLALIASCLPTLHVFSALPRVKRLGQALRRLKLKLQSIASPNKAAKDDSGAPSSASKGPSSSDLPQPHVEVDRTDQKGNGVAQAIFFQRHITNNSFSGWLGDERGNIIRIDDEFRVDYGAHEMA